MKPLSKTKPYRASAQPYLRSSQEHAARPGGSQQQPVAAPDTGEGSEDGGVPVQADDHQHQGGRVHGEELEEVEELAGELAAVPLHRHVPHGVQGHHRHRHQQVGQRQAEDERPHVGFPPLPQQAAQHRRVAARRQQEEDGRDGHTHPGRLREPGFDPVLGAASGRGVEVPVRGEVAGRRAGLAHALPKRWWPRDPLVGGEECGVSSRKAAGNWGGMGRRWDVKGWNKGGGASSSPRLSAPCLRRAARVGDAARVPSPAPTVAIAIPCPDVFLALCEAVEQLWSGGWGHGTSAWLGMSFFASRPHLFLKTHDFH